MYSAVALPSMQRAAPAKKRRLSTITGGSDLATSMGLPVFCASSWAISSAWLSIAPASLRSISARSPGVVSLHSGSAAFAAATARSTSAWLPWGTSAITSPVAGLRISCGPSSASASTHSPPTKFLCCVTATLMSPSLARSDLHPDEPGQGGGRAGCDRAATTPLLRLFAREDSCPDDTAAGAPKRLRRKAGHAAVGERKRRPLVLPAADERRENLTAEPSGADAAAGVAEPVLDARPRDGAEEGQVVGRDVDRPAPRSLDPRAGEAG